jgi:hypothetical protein
MNDLSLYLHCRKLDFRRSTVTDVTWHRERNSSQLNQRDNCEQDFLTLEKIYQKSTIKEQSLSLERAQKRKECRWLGGKRQEFSRW